MILSLFLNAFQFENFSEGDIGTLRFKNCWRYRLGQTNDEGWYRGQCRFSRLAPGWGEFYEVAGDLLIDDRPIGQDPVEWSVKGDPSPASRHFLFYLRDDTFECDADDWEFVVTPAAAP